MFIKMHRRGKMLQLHMLYPEERHLNHSFGKEKDKRYPHLITLLLDEKDLLKSNVQLLSYMHLSKLQLSLKISSK